MATTKKEKDFKFFSKLPQELQDQVWDTTAEQEICGTKVYIKKGLLSKKMMVKTTEPSPSLLSTSYAARQRALKHYTSSIEWKDCIFRFNGDSEVILILDGKRPDRNQPWPVNKTLPGKYNNIKTIGIPASACVWVEGYLRSGFFSKFENLQHLVIFFCCACCPGSHHKDSEQCAAQSMEQIQSQRVPYVQHVMDRLAEYQQNVNPNFSLELSTAHFEVPQKHRLCDRATPALGLMAGNMGAGCVVM